jgi:hypothetical protein
LNDGSNDVQLVPSPEWLELLKQTVLRIWHEKFDQVLAELELSEAPVEQFDIDSALAKAISVLNNASALWIERTARGPAAAPGGYCPAGPHLGWRGIRTRLRACPSATWRRSNEQNSRRMRSMEFKPTKLLNLQRVGQRIAGWSK